MCGGCGGTLSGPVQSHDQLGGGGTGTAGLVHGGFIWMQKGLIIIALHGFK